MNLNINFMDRLRLRLKSVEHKIFQYRHSTNETIVAETEYGKVKGTKRLAAYDDIPYYSFEGIPYAQPPVGELRFKAPKRPEKWEGEKDCTQPKDKSVQKNMFFRNIEGSEDCLYLNVYTKNLTPETPRPVMVWIHGGGFMVGEANRDWFAPDYFMQKDVILVTIQYRLGALGFLSLNEPTLNVPGNAGLKDQILALKWVKENIAKFGGNPDCITIFGESAGGASVHYLTLTEQTRDLFQRGIIMSGSALARWAHGENITHRAFALAKLAGYKGENNDKDVYEFLCKAKARDLVALDDKVLAPEEADAIVPFPPCIEPYVSEDCVVPEHPRELQRKTWSNGIPLMIGCTSFEGLLFQDALIEPKMLPALVQQLDSCIHFVPADVADADRTSENTIDLGKKLKDSHVPGEKPVTANLLDLLSYAHFYFPVYRMILSRLTYGNAASYMYRFDFESDNVVFPYAIHKARRVIKGVSHAEELAYLFWSTTATRLSKTSAEYRNMQRMVNIWVKFAEAGNPNDEKFEDMASINWEPLKKSEEPLKCLNINKELSYTDMPEWQKLKVWESLYENKKELLC